ncbi:MAG TPA: acyltransferase [Acidimicrobiales bacterium]|nr:acyltransferase [Acidimicrobiales bacterium]
MAASRLAQLDAGDARRLGHIPALDGVRALAIVFVMLLHFSSPWRRGEYGAFAGGYVGVDVFFVLSGFLITSLLVGEQAARGGVSLVAFYARRVLRLLPALVLLLIAHAVFVQRTSGDMETEAKSVAVILLYVSNLAQAAGFDELLGSSLSFTWSLSIEEQFYLLWPAILLLGALRFAPSRRVLLAGLAIAALASGALRAYTWLHEADYVAAYMRTDGRVDGLLIGALAAFAWRWRLVPTRYLNVAATGSLVLLVTVATFATKPGDAMFTFGFTGVALAAAVIVVAIAEDAWSLTALFATAPLRAIGRVSYGLYLWQGLSLRIALRTFRFDHGPLAIATLALGICVLAVVTSWFAVERPALRLKQRFESVPSGSEPLGVAGQHEADA